MKRFLSMSKLSLLLLAAGCGSYKPLAEAPDDEGSINALMVHTQLDQNVRTGIISQRTLYPYHFAPNSSSLNELGEHQVEVLAAAFKGTTHVTVARGDDSTELHDARVQTVRDKLVAAGITPANVIVGDGPPGGLGMSSKAALEVMNPPADSKTTTDTAEKSRNGTSRSASESGRGTGTGTESNGYGGK